MHKEKSLLNNYNQASRGVTPPRQACSTRPNNARMVQLGLGNALTDSWNDGEFHDGPQKLFIC